MTYYVKAIYAGLVTFLGSMIGVLQAGSGGISVESWLVIFLATVVSVGGVLGLQAAPASVATSVKQ